MLKKQYTKAIIIIAILTIGVLFGMTAKADEPIMSEPKPLHIKVQGWVEQEWNDIKEYQAQSWEDGKAQLARNKEQIIGLWNKLKQN